MGGGCSAETVCLSGDGALGVVDKALNDFCAINVLSTGGEELLDGGCTEGKLKVCDEGLALTLGAAAICDCSPIAVVVFWIIAGVDWSLEPAGDAGTEGGGLKNCGEGCEETGGNVKGCDAETGSGVAGCLLEEDC